MGFLAVLVGAIASYVFGAIWYMALAKPWMVAAGVTEEQVNSGDKKPYIVAFVATVVVAGMMRHIFVMSGVNDVFNGLISGLGLGLFIAVPWLVMNHSFGMKPRNLTLIDGGYATGGSMVMGAVLGYFM